MIDERLVELDDCLFGLLLYNSFDREDDDDEVLLLLSTDEDEIER